MSTICSVCDDIKYELIMHDVMMTSCLNHSVMITYHHLVRVISQDSLSVHLHTFRQSSLILLDRPIFFTWDRPYKQPSTLDVTLCNQSVRSGTNTWYLGTEMDVHNGFLKSKNESKRVFQQKQTGYFFNLEWGSN